MLSAADGTSSVQGFLDVWVVVGPLVGGIIGAALTGWFTQRAENARADAVVAAERRGDVRRLLDPVVTAVSKANTHAAVWQLISEVADEIPDALKDEDVKKTRDQAARSASELRTQSVQMRAHGYKGISEDLTNMAFECERAARADRPTATDIERIERHMDTIIEMLAAELRAR